jgi:hypothetical protein
MRGEKGYWLQEYFPEGLVERTCLQVAGLDQREIMREE